MFLITMSTVIDNAITESAQTIVEVLLYAFAVYIQTSVLELLQGILSLISQSGTAFFENNTVQSIMWFGESVSWVVFGVSIIFAFKDIAEEYAAGHYVNYGSVFLNFIKAFAFILLANKGGQYIMQLGYLVTSYVDFSSVPMISSVIIFKGTSAVFMARMGTGLSLLITGIMLIGSIGIFISMLKSVGAVMIYISTTGFYVGDILRGDSTKLGEWIRQVAAVAITYTVQYILLIASVSLVFCGALNSTDYIIGLILFFVCLAAPRLLDKIGFSAFSGGRGISGAIQNTSAAASTGFYATNTIKSFIGK